LEREALRAELGLTAAAAGGALARCRARAAGQKSRRMIPRGAPAPAAVPAPVPVAVAPDEQAVAMRLTKLVLEFGLDDVRPVDLQKPLRDLVHAVLRRAER
jgi:hypothetical protein